MNIFLGSLWILIGLGLLVYEPLTGNAAPGIRVGENYINAGWLALTLGAWNGARLWSASSYRKHDEMLREAMLQRDRTRKMEEKPLIEEFRFNDEKPP